MLIVPPPRQQTDRSATDSSNSRELKSDEQRQHGSTHDPRPSCAGTAQVQTLAGRAGDMDGLSGNVPLHCTSQVQLTAHANAWAESFMKTLKVEEVDGRRYRNFDHAKSSIAAFIEEVYNQQRLHSALDYRSPMEFETDLKNRIVRRTPKKGASLSVDGIGDRGL
jgi:transposase InsO family protein